MIRKHAPLAALLCNLISTSVFAQDDCPDLSGVYWKIGGAKDPEIRYQIRQYGCDWFDFIRVIYSPEGQSFNYQDQIRLDGVCRSEVVHPDWSDRYCMQASISTSGILMETLKMGDPSPSGRTWLRRDWQKNLWIDVVTLDPQGNEIQRVSWQALAGEE